MPEGGTDPRETIGRFELRRRIGTGHTGIVYEALDRDSGELVAIKTLKAVTAESLYRLKREFRLLHTLAHRNLCTVYELLEDDGQWFVTMELVRGHDFLDHVSRRIDDADEIATGAPRFDDRRLRRALAQLAAGLHALHEAGLVHRDIKPGNVLVTRDGRVVLLDFGFVLDTDATASQSSTIVGTPRYMAPEQAITGEVGPSADWYSVGVMLYEALTGVPPHDTEGHVLRLLMDKQRVEPKSPRQRVVGVPEDLDALCVELLRIDPELRPDGRMVQQLLGVTARAQLLSPAASTASLLDAFVGRDAELTALRTAYEEVRDGSPVLFLIDGPSGVGKSALIKRFTDSVAGDGAVILSGRCFELESVPYKAFDSVIDALSRHLRALGDVRVAGLVPQHPDALIRLFPVLGAVPALADAPVGRVAPREPQDLRDRAFSALRETLYRLGQRTPLVVTIDDWQWADADSVALARELLRHRDAPTMLLLASLGTPLGTDVRGRVEIGVADTRTLSLEALDQRNAVELAELLLAMLAPGVQVDVAQIVRESGGNPLHLSELIRYVASRPAGSTGSIRLEAAVGARVGELRSESLRILEALAIAGEPLPLPVVRDMVELPQTEFQRIVATLRVANLVRWGASRNSLELNHQFVRDRVLGKLNQQGLRQWNRGAARVVEASPLARERPELLVRLYEASGQSARAAALAVSAAEVAAAAAAFDRAAELYQTALRLGTFEDVQLRAIRIALGEALANAGRGQDSAHALLLAAEGAEPASRRQCHRQAAEQLLMSGHIEEGLAVLGRLLADVGFRLPATPGQALRSVIARRALLRVRGLTWRERRPGQIAPEDLVRLDVLRAASLGLSMVDNIRGADFNARWLLDALRTGEQTRCAIALATEAMYVSSAGIGKARRARALIAKVARVAEESGDPWIVGYQAIAEAGAEYFGGVLSRARDRARAAETIFQTCAGSRYELNNARMILAWALRAMGSWKELDEIVVGYLADAERRGDRYLYTSLVRHAGVLWLARDDVAGAHAMMERATWVPSEVGFHAQHWYELEIRSEIALYEGKVEAAAPVLAPMRERLAGSMLLRVITIRIAALWLDARLALATGAPQLAATSARRLDKVGDPRATVAARLVRAALARRAGNAAGAATLLREAIEVGARAELHLLVAIARLRLGEAIGGDEGDAALLQADAWMRRQGIVAPARIAAMYAPP